MDGTMDGPFDGLQAHHFAVIRKAAHPETEQEHQKRVNARIAPPPSPTSPVLVCRGRSSCCSLRPLRVLSVRAAYVWSCVIRPALPLCAVSILCRCFATGCFCQQCWMIFCPRTLLCADFTCRSNGRCVLLVHLVVHIPPRCRRLALHAALLLALALAIPVHHVTLGVATDGAFNGSFPGGKHSEPLPRCAGGGGHGGAAGDQLSRCTCHLSVDPQGLRLTLLLLLSLFVIPTRGNSTPTAVA